ncbi:hypothetical protein Tco_0678485 [Tanacetum coccineum]|uniref:Uncharacterized protein n=1 Tax=Tanacetum coccineum TaxID=301880 RepID=A0ABQ4XFE0_9ASTR
MTVANSQRKSCNFINHINLTKPIPSSNNLLKTKIKVPQGKKSRARSGLRRKQSSKHTSESKTEASKSKTGQSDKETQSSSAKDKIPSHLSPSTPVVGEMRKEAHFFHYHSESASGCDALANFTTKADPRISAPNDFIPEQQDKTKSAGDGLKTAHTDLSTNEESRSDEISKKIKLEDISNLMYDTRSSFLTPDSPRDEPTIILDESEEEKTERYEDTHTTSHDGPEDTSIPHPPSPKSVQIQELMAQVQLLQSQKQPRTKAKAEAEFAP